MKNWFMSTYIMVCCYSVGAFVNWDYNAGNWSEFARFTVALAWFVVSIVWASYEAERKVRSMNNEIT
jgi:uncharacterized membrane protein